MCNLFRCEVDDPRIEEMEPMRKMWMFYNWIADQQDRVELAKNQAYLVGSFINPEAVKKLIGQDGGATHKSTEEEFEKTTQLMDKEVEKNQKASKKRKKRKIKE